MREVRAHEAALQEAGELARVRERVAAEPTPATYSILTGLKAGETVYQTGELPKTL